MWGRVPPKHWAHLQVIDCTLREDARHTAAAVMGMWDAYRSIQAKVVGQDPLELGLREVEGIRHRYCKQSKPRAFAQSLCHSQALPITGTVVRCQESSPPEPLAQRP